MFSSQKITTLSRPYPITTRINPRPSTIAYTHRMNDSGLTYLLALAVALLLSVVFWPVPRVVAGEPRSICQALSISKTASECLRVRGSFEALSLLGGVMRPMEERVRFSHAGLRVIGRSGKSRYDGKAFTAALMSNMGREPLSLVEAPSKRGGFTSLC